MYREMTTINEAVEKLRREGYTENFSLKNEEIESDAGKTYLPGELIIEKTQRYEGDSDPSENAIIYAITAKDGARGVLLDSYGAYADPKLAKIIGDIPVREEHDMQV